MGDGWRICKEEKYYDLEAGVGNETGINMNIYCKLKDTNGIKNGYMVSILGVLFNISYIE